MSAKAKRILALLKDPRHRERLLKSLNDDNLDEVGPLGNDQGMKVLNEINEFQSDHDDFVKSLMPNVGGL